MSLLPTPTPPTQPPSTPNHPPPPLVFTFTVEQESRGEDELVCSLRTPQLWSSSRTTFEMKRHPLMCGGDIFEEENFSLLHECKIPGVL